MGDKGGFNHVFEIIAMFLAMLTFVVFSITLWAVSRGARSRAKPQIPRAETVIDGVPSTWNARAWLVQIQGGAQTRMATIARWAPLILLSIALTGIVMMGLMFLFGIVVILL